VTSSISTVIPAKAGIQLITGLFIDSRLRGNDVLTYMNEKYVSLHNLISLKLFALKAKILKLETGL
jgi:hypothetical protein